MSFIRGTASVWITSHSPAPTQVAEPLVIEDEDIAVGADDDALLEGAGEGQEGAEYGVFLQSRVACFFVHGQQGTGGLDGQFPSVESGPDLGDVGDEVPNLVVLA